MASTSLEDITSRAGASKGLFYLYFHSKDELLHALQDQFSVELAERIRDATGGVADWPGKLDACVRAIFDGYQERHQLHEVLFHHAGHVPASHTATHAIPVDAIQEVLSGGVAAGVFEIEDPEATALLCWATAHGFDLGFAGQPGPPGPRLLRAAQLLFRRAAGISAGPPD